MRWRSRGAVTLPRQSRTIATQADLRRDHRQSAIGSGAGLRRKRSLWLSCFSMSYRNAIISCFARDPCALISLFAPSTMHKLLHCNVATTWQVNRPSWIGIRPCFALVDQSLSHCSKSNKASSAPHPDSPSWPASANRHDVQMTCVRK